VAHEVTLKLPPLVASTTDVGRLIREVEAIDESLHQLKLRKSAAADKAPKTSQLMDKMVELNKLNLVHETDRQELKAYLEAVREKAPVLHMSFSADPSVQFVEKLISWLRREIHPQALLTIGLQPNIGAGCILRTTNKIFDLSLRQDFAQKKDVLIKRLTPTHRAAAPAPPPAPAAAAPAVPVPVSSAPSGAAQ
jgi:hypothetical protein